MKDRRLRHRFVGILIILAGFGCASSGVEVGVPEMGEIKESEETISPSYDPPAPQVLPDRPDCRRCFAPISDKLAFWTSVSIDFNDWIAYAVELEKLWLAENTRRKLEPQ